MTSTASIDQQNTLLAQQQLLQQQLLAQQTEQVSARLSQQAADAQSNTAAVSTASAVAITSQPAGVTGAFSSALSQLTPDASATGAPKAPTGHHGHHGGGKVRQAVETYSEQSGSASDASAGGDSAENLDAA